MRLIARTLFDPAFDRVDALVVEFRMPVVGGRHAQRGTIADDPLVDLAFVRLTGNERESARFQLCLGAGLVVETHRSLAIAGIRTMAGIAAIRQNRTNFPVEID